MKQRIAVGLDIDEPEQWKEVYSGYEISSYGRIRSWKNNHKGRRTAPKLLSTRKDKDGYVISTIYINGKRKDKKVHRLVGIAFVPNPLNKKYINHKDGIKDNNYYKNIEWSTMSENTKHAYTNGLASNKGESGPNVLTKEEVLEIRDRYKPRKVTMQKLADEYNVSRGQIFRIIKRINWTHI